MPFRLDAAAADFREKFEQLLHMKRETAEDVDAIVRDIIADVIARGDEALIDYTAVSTATILTPETLRISREEIDDCGRRLPARSRSRRWSWRATASSLFHEKQRPSDLRFTDAAGVELGWRWSAVESVGLYVPGGTAAYPSSVLMNAVPAKVAGRRAAGHGRAGARRQTVAAGAGGGPSRRRRRGLSHRRRPGGGGAGLWHRDHRAGRQDRRAGQRLCRRRQAPGVRPGAAST